MPIVFSAIVPHPPIILPSVGSEKDRSKVEQTINQLKEVSLRMKKLNPEAIIISSPHPDWGVKVPLYFLVSADQEIEEHRTADNSALNIGNSKVLPVLTTSDSPEQHFDWGKKVYSEIKNSNLKIALIASGDLSHSLKPDGPYGFHPDGPSFDDDLIESLKRKDIDNILNLEKKYPMAQECGLRSFCYILGILEESRIGYSPEVLSYDNFFGVGYLVLDFKI